MAAREDSDCDTYVIPIPYYDKNPDGTFREEHYEGKLFPDEVPITRYDEYDFGIRMPDVIFIHNPYDKGNYVTSVHPYFYSKNLKNFTEKLVYEIVSRTVRAIQKPVTVKIRKGFDDNHVNAVEIAKIVEEAGGAAVAVHGRTREQYYSGKADWEIIRQVKKAVSIPVIGNGDVVSSESALSMLKQTGCDGVMVGRGAQGNPWIFRELVEYGRTGALPERPSRSRVKEAMLRHARLQIDFKGDYLGIREMRKHVAWYTKGMEGAAKLRDAINRVESYSGLEELLNLHL